jgi:hypothetical protein
MRIVVNAFLGARRVGLVFGLIRFAVGRLCVLTVLGLVWFAIDICPARAQGCHVPERPTLGYSTTSAADQFEIDSLWMPPFQSEVLVIPHPCSGNEALGSIPRSAAAAAIGELRPPGVVPCVSGWIAPSGPTTRPRDDSSRVDRPPRLNPLAL